MQGYCGIVHLLLSYILHLFKSGWCSSGDPAHHKRVKSYYALSTSINFTFCSPPPHSTPDGLSCLVVGTYSYIKASSRQHAIILHTHILSYLLFSFNAKSFLSLRLLKLPFYTVINHIRNQHGVILMHFSSNSITMDMAFPNHIRLPI